MQINMSPSRAADMDTDVSGTQAISNEWAVPGKTGKPPPLILTYTTDLIQLQTELKIVVKRNLSSVALETEPKL
jgi:hypothetical protein